MKTVVTRIATTLIYFLHAILVATFLATVFFVIRALFSFQFDQETAITISESGPSVVKTVVDQWPTITLGIGIAIATVKSLINIVFRKNEKSEDPLSTSFLIKRLRKTITVRLLQIFALPILLPIIFWLQIISISSGADLEQKFISFLFIPLFFVLAFHDILFHSLLLSLDYKSRKHHMKFKQTVVSKITLVNFLR